MQDSSLRARQAVQGQVILDFTRFLGSLLQSRSALASENLFLRKQLALYQERQVQPRRATDATRLTMVLLGRLFNWKKAFVSIRPETFTGWHRRGLNCSGGGNPDPSADPGFPKICVNSSWPWPRVTSKSRVTREEILDKSWEGAKKSWGKRARGGESG